MIKELSVQEVARKLADEGCFEGLLRDNNNEKWIKRTITGAYFSSRDFPIITEKENYLHCAIEIPDPEPVYEPYPDDICPPLKCGDMIVGKSNGIEFIVTGLDKRTYKKIHIFFCDNWISNKNLFENYTYQDGSPIGRRKEQVC